MSASIEEQDGEWILTLTVPESVANAHQKPVTTERLSTTIFSEAAFDCADGSPLDLSHELMGMPRTVVRQSPFADLKPGTQTFVVWSKIQN